MKLKLEMKNEINNIYNKLDMMDNKIDNLGFNLNSKSE
jgi:hypothetical protein